MNRAETIRLATRLVVYPIGGFVAIAGTAGGINQVIATAGSGAVSLVIV